MSEREEVLVTVPRTLFEKAGAFQGITPLSPKHLPLLLEENFVHIPRSKAEEDTNYKQLVVYFTVRDREQYLSYWRKNGDKRLLNRYTMGFGGHVNTEDTSFLGAVARELTEEIGNSPVKTIQLMGLINNDDSPVGQVHLGLFYEVTLFHWHEKAAGDEQARLTSWPALESNKEAMEGWSRMVFEYLNRSSL